MSFKEVIYSFFSKSCTIGHIIDYCWVVILLTRMITKIMHHPLLDQLIDLGFTDRIVYNS